MIDTDATENEAEAPGQLDNSKDELVKEINDNLRAGRKHWAEWRAEARGDYDFFAGRQWDEDDAKKLKADNRPAIVFNRTMRTINAVSGMERQNRYEVRYHRKEMETSSGVAEIMNSAASSVRSNCDAEDEESESFLDAAICGVGWTETRIDYEEDPEGTILIDRIDPLEMLVDHNSKKRNFADARWMARIKEMTKKECKQLWPDEENQAGTFWNDLEGAPHDADEAKNYENDQSGNLSKSGMITVVQYQYWERYHTYMAEDPETGSLVEMPEERFKKIQSLLDEKKARYIKIPKRKYYQCFLNGDKLLEKIPLDCDHFKFNAITGLRDKTKNVWFGLIRPMRDPQMWANKWLSQIMHIINTGAKNGIYAEEGAIPNQSKFETTHSQPGSVSTVAVGAISGQRILPKQAPAYPDGVDRLLQYAVQAVNDVTGVSLEMIGMADRDQPIGLEESRKKAGIVLLATFFDSLRLYRKKQGRVLAYYIYTYISDGRLIRMVGEEGAKYVPLKKDQLTLKYDILVDDAPTSPNMKEIVFRVLNQILPLALQSGIPIPPDLLDYMPLPDALIQKWKMFIKENQAQDPFAEQMKQLELVLGQLDAQQKDMQNKKLAAEIQVMSSEIPLNMAKAEQAAAIGQDESAQAAQKMGVTQHDQQMKEQGMLIEQARKYVEMIMSHTRKKEEAQLNARLKAQQFSQQSQAMQ